jgi:uncharacterized protein (DUF58 family)
MIRNRLMCIGIVVFTISFVFFYGGKVPYLLLYTVSATIAASALHALLAWRLCGAGCSLDKAEIVRGEDVLLRFEISNRTPLFLPYVNIALRRIDEFSYAADSDSLSVEPFSKKAMSLRLTGKYRGRYDVNVIDARIMDFLGLISLRLRYKKAPHVVVYPRLADLDGFDAAEQLGMESSLNAGNVSEDLSAVSDVRDYIDGDGIRRIHWKLSARAQSLISKEYESEAKSRAALLIDLRKATGNREDQLKTEEQIVEAALSVLLCFLKRAWSVDIGYFEEGFVNYGVQDVRLFEAAYERLSFVGFDAERDIALAFGGAGVGMGMGMGAGELLNICVVTQDVSDELLERMLKLSEHGCSISLLYVCEDKTRVDATLWASIVKKSAIRLYALGFGDDLKTALMPTPAA